MMSLPDDLQTGAILAAMRISREAAAADPAHDFTHCTRVLVSALAISEREGADREVLAAAAFLHDIANLPKSHPDSAKSSERSADRAVEILRAEGFPETKLPLVHDAILCHSYSRGLTPQTKEGRVFQDADRLDALGAIGIARTFAVGGATNRPLYWPDDPFCQKGRQPCDKPSPSHPHPETANTLDHFFVKLFRLPELMATPAGRALAEERVAFMKAFLSQLGRETGEGQLIS